MARHVPPMADWPYPAPADDGAAGHLSPGTQLPAIHLPSTLGGEIDLATVPGLACIFVYPWTGRPGMPNPLGWDDIPGAHGSTPEAEGFRDHYTAFAALGAAVFGVSAQDTSYQQELARRIGLPFALLSDSDFKFQRALALPCFTACEETFLKRLTLVARDGNLAKVFYPVHPPDRHAEAVLAWLSTENA